MAINVPRDAIVADPILPTRNNHSEWGIDIDRSGAECLDNV